MAYRKAYNVELTLAMAYRCNLESNDLLDLKNEMVIELKDGGHIKKAADLLVTISGYDIIEAIKLYSKANSFDEAIREVMKNYEQNKNMLKDTILPSVNLAYDVKKNQVLK
jgi:hypothetical protein